MKLISEDTHASPPAEEGREEQQQTAFSILVHLLVCPNKYISSLSQYKLIDNMKTFQIVTLFALVAAAMAFAPNSVNQGEYRSP